MLLSRKIRWEDFLKPWIWEQQQHKWSKNQEHISTQEQIEGKTIIQESDQFAAGEFLQQNHEDKPILDVLEQVLDLDGRVALKSDTRNDGVLFISLYLPSIYRKI